MPRNETVKAFEYENGEFVTASAEDFEKANVEATHSIDIQDFVDAPDIDPIYFSRPYYVAPIPKSEKGYLLLRESLRNTEKVGIAKVVIHGREHIAAIMIHDEALRLAHDAFQRRNSQH